VERSGGCRRIEEDLAHEHEVMAAAARRRGKPLAEAVERLGANALDRDQSFFFKARDLAREGMKFAVARQYARTASRRQRGEEAPEEIVRVGRERDGRRIGQRE